MDDIKRRYFTFEKDLDKELESIPLLCLLESKIPNNKVKKAHIVMGTSVFLFLFVLFGFFETFVCNLVGFIYPAYMSIKAIDSKDKDDDTQWLTYWVVFALFILLEHLSIAAYLPGYFILKFAFLVWLLSPFTRGAKVVYDNVLTKLVNSKKHH